MTSECFPFFPTGTGSIDPRVPTKSHPTPGGGGGGWTPTHPEILPDPPTHPPPTRGVGRTLSKTLGRRWFPQVGYCAAHLVSSAVVEGVVPPGGVLCSTPGVQCCGGGGGSQRDEMVTTASSATALDRSWSVHPGRHWCSPEPHTHAHIDTHTPTHACVLVLRTLDNVAYIFLLHYLLGSFKWPLPFAFA